MLLIVVSLSHSSIFINITKNKIMLLVFGLTFLLQIIITQFGGAFFRTVPLTFEMWIKIGCLAFSVIVASEIFKAILRIFAKEKITQVENTYTKAN